jgi:DNA-binding transcriptional MerR regulator
MESPISQLQKIQEQTEHLKQKLDNLKKVREEAINTIMKDENLLRLLISQDYRIEVAMTLTNYSISKTAKMLGVSTRTINRSIANQNKKQGIK